MSADGSGDSQGFSARYANSRAVALHDEETPDFEGNDNAAGMHPFGPPWSSSRERQAQADRVRPERVLGLAVALIVHGLFGFWLLLARPGETPNAVTTPALEAVFVDMTTPMVAPPPPLPQPPVETPPPPLVEPEPAAEPVLPDAPAPVQAMAQPTSAVEQAIAPSAAIATASASPQAASAIAQPAAAIDLTSIQTGPLNEWQITLLRHLHQHLRYPLQARRRHQQGVTLVRFVIDRGGRLHSALIEDSSGHDLLDEEALAVLARAQPLPPPPASVAGASIEIVVPISYRLRRS